MKNNSIIKILSIIIVITMFVAVFYPCSLFSQVRAKKIFTRIALNGPPNIKYAGIYLALYNDYYSDEKLEFKIVNNRNHNECVDKFFKSNLEFGISNLSVLNNTKDIDPIIIGSYFRHNPFYIVSNKSSNISSLKDLEGRNVFFNSDTTMLLLQLKKSKVDINKINFVRRKLSLRDVAENNSSVFFINLFNESINIDSLFVNFNVIKVSDKNLNPFDEVYFTSNRVVNLKTEIIDKFLRATDKGWNFFINNRSKSILLLKQNFLLDYTINDLNIEYDKLLSLLDTSSYMLNNVNKNQFHNLNYLLYNYKLSKERFSYINNVYDQNIQIIEGFSRIPFVIAIFLFILGILLIVWLLKLSQKQRLTLQHEQELIEELKENESKFILLTENIKDVVWIMDYETLLFQFISPSVIKFNGFYPAEIIKKPFYEWIIGDRSILKEMIDNLLEKYNLNPSIKRYATTNVEFKHKNGDIISAESIITIQNNPQNGRLELIGVTRDISERKKQLDQINMLNLAVEQSFASILITDIYSNITYVNDVFTSMTGYSKDEVIGETPHLLSSGEMEDAYYKEMWNTIKAGKSWKGEFINKKKDGSLYNIISYISPVKNEKNEIVNYLEVSIDITQNKIIENALLDSELNFKVIMETLPVAFVIMQDGKAALHNKYFNELTKYSDEEIAKKSIYDFFVPEAKETMFSNAVNLFSTGDSVYSYETAGVDKNGEIKPILLNAALLNYKGKPAIISSVVDITKRKELEKQLKNINYTKDKFFSIISHDLKNPIGSLRNLLELLSDSYNSITEEERIESINSMKDTSTQLYYLLENLLEWSRSQQGTIMYNPDHVLINQIVDNTILILKEHAHIKNIKINNNIYKETYIYADVSMISTVIRNLISNAIKFTEEGGVINISNSSNQNHDIITIVDSGIGMDDETLDKLFEIGNKSSRVGTVGEQGTGLGLILCKEFIDKHNGKIWAESISGTGSKFSFTIPKVKI